MTTFKSRAARVAALVVRMALGAFFITSAVLKLLSIDEFEVYLFSYNVLSLRASMLAARLVIAAEALVGIGLMANIWKRFVDLSALLMLVGFTVFLCFSTLAGRSENCQCMGAMIEISPVQSILKNAVLLLLLVFAMGSRPWDWHPRWFLWLPAVLAPVVAVFVISAPDSWLFGPDEEVYNSEFLKEAMAPEGDLACTGIGNGRKVVAFLTPGCAYCRMADEKLTHIRQRGDLDSAAFIYLIPTRDSLGTQPTMDSTTFHQAAYRLTSKTFALITYGQRPMVFLMEDGRVKATCHYRNIDEGQITAFLRNE